MLGHPTRVWVVSGCRFVSHAMTFWVRAALLADTHNIDKPVQLLIIQTMKPPGNVLMAIDTLDTLTEWNKRLQPSSGVALMCCFAFDAPDIFCFHLQLIQFLHFLKREFCIKRPVKLTAFLLSADKLLPLYLLTEMMLHYLTNH